MVSEQDILVLIPAFNEQDRIGAVIVDARREMPKAKVLVVDDGSSDNTADVSRSAGAQVVSHPFNLGVGGALQTGYKFAVQRGFRYVIQLDGDGQHSPAFLRTFLSQLNETEADLIIGSRFIRGYSVKGGFFRTAGNALFAKLLSALIRERLTDPTSGYRALKATVLQFCVQDTYGFDYPDADFLLTLHRAGFKMEEIPIEVAPRSGGMSQHSGLAPIYYMIKMFLSIFIILLRKRTVNRT
ncbi:MAG: glycosyltransferase family 2 protein [Ignavibacteriales bacterium]|nr:glycosyltransferase family 2 protein [Ignavibacteriales bacterium]